MNRCAPPPAALAGLVLLTGVTLLAACGEGGGGESEAPRAPAARDGLSSADLGGLDVRDVALNLDWTSGVINRSADAQDSLRVLQEASFSEQEGFDRMVLTFRGENSFTGYRLHYGQEPPTQCGSGRTAELAGEAWLSVSLQPAQAHDDQGEATVDERERTFDFPNLQEAEILCDFEAELTWGLGLRATTPYRILEMRDPLRLVVDVQHPSAEAPATEDSAMADTAAMR